jgi:hypothetical protein
LLTVISAENQPGAIFLNTTRGKAAQRSGMMIVTMIGLSARVIESINSGFYKAAYKAYFKKKR